MKITCIAGLPGSGKTTLCRRLSGAGVAIFDDPTDLAEIARCGGDHIYIADSRFCLEESRRNAVAALGRLFPEAEIEFWFFENDPSRCLRNAEARDDGRSVRGYITFLSRCYRIPNGSKIMPVWAG